MTVLDYKRIGQRIRETRMKRHMSVEELSSLVEISPSYLHRIESGAVNSISLPAFVRIVNALETTADALIYGGNSERRRFS